MHQSSYAKMASFFRSYQDRFPKTEGVSRVLEVGSKSYEGQPTYRGLIDHSIQTYTGLDLEPGHNVDIVPKRRFVWAEIADERFDVCISGQSFEHNPFFWITMAEIARILAPAGYACIIAPGSGLVHRFPLDCWRFYPDSWAALCALTGLELVEAYFEPDDMAMKVLGGNFRDNLLIAKKPTTESVELKERRRKLVEPFKDGFGTFESVAQKEGPCIEDYRKTVQKGRGLRARVANWISPWGPVRTYDPVAMEANSNASSN